MPPHSAFAPFTDPQAVRTLLRDHVKEFFGAPLELVGCDVLHAWRKTYENPQSWDKAYLNVCYRLHVRNRAPALMHGTAFYHHRGEPAQRALHHAPLATLQMAGLDLALRRFPDDPSLPQLALLANTARLIEWVPAAVLPELTLMREVKLEVINYRPGERCTLRYDVFLRDSAHPLSLFAKTYRDTTGASVHGHLLEMYSRGAQRPRVRVAEPLGYDAATRTVWQRAAQGERAAALLGGPAQDGAVRAMARSLCALHSAGLSYERIVLRDQLLFEARKRANKLAAAFVNLAPALQDIVEGCAQQRRALPVAEAALLHGDAHVNQFLIADGEAVMFDFDELTCGDAEHDLANFIISLQLDSPPGSERTAVASFLRECAERMAHPVNPALLLWHYRVQLISKAYRAFWRQAPQAQSIVARAVALASEEVPAWL